MYIGRGEAEITTHSVLGNIQLLIYIIKIKAPMAARFLDILIRVGNDLSYPVWIS